MLILIRSGHKQQKLQLALVAFVWPEVGSGQLREEVVVVVLGHCVAAKWSAFPVCMPLVCLPLERKQCVVEKEGHFEGTFHLETSQRRALRGGQTGIAFVCCTEASSLKEATHKRPDSMLWDRVRPTSCAL